MTDPADPLSLIDPPPAAPDPQVTVEVRLTPEILQAVAPKTRLSTLQMHLVPLQRALDLANAGSPRRAAAMLAELAFESAWFNRLREEPSTASGPNFERYEFRADLGNVLSGDGPRFCGRGYIETTGRRNMARAGQVLGLPLEEQPDLAEKPEVAARMAAVYWTDHRINDPADALDLREVTRRINPGLAGYEFRLAAYRHACAALGVTLPEGFR